MQYFSADFLQFFKELEENNHKEWFDQNRKRYEKEVKEPFKSFIGDLIIAIQKFDPEIMIKPKDAIFRINRDIRFSKNKQPYKLNVAAFLSKQSKKEEFPGYYIHFDAKGIWLGGGLYQISTDLIYKVRQEILYNDKEFKKAINDKTFIEEFGTLKGERNKILKPPYKEYGNEIPELYMKQFYFMNEYPAEWITKDNLLEICTEKLSKAYEVLKFLRLATEEIDT